MSRSCRNWPWRGQPLPATNATERPGRGNFRTRCAGTYDPPIVRHTPEVRESVTQSPIPTEYTAWWVRINKVCSAHQQLQRPLGHVDDSQLLLVGAVDKHLAVGHVNTPSRIGRHALAAALDKYLQILQLAFRPDCSAVGPRLRAAADVDARARLGDRKPISVERMREPPAAVVRRPCGKHGKPAAPRCHPARRTRGFGGVATSRANSSASVGNDRWPDRTDP